MSKSKRRDIYDIFGILNDNKDEIENNDHSSPFIQKGKNVKEEGRVMHRVRFLFLERESVPLLSKISINPTVGFLQSKKKSCSTRRGQRVGTGFLEFYPT